MSDYFVYNGMDSRTYGIVLFDVNTESTSAQEYDTQQIPGKSGDLLLRKHRYPNQAISYQAVIYEDYATHISQFKGMLLSRNGYCRLEDSFHPDEFYMASFRDVLEVTKYKDGTMGKFTLNFDRKPQRYLKSGETVTTLTASRTISNPTNFDAKPLLRVYGAGILGIGSQYITILSADEYTDIDCEIMECYKGTSSRNSRVSISGTDFPVLHPASNSISLGTGISKVEITPRWWRL